MTVPEKVPAVHVGVAPVATPLPPSVTVRPFSEQVPLTATPLAALKYAEAAGLVMATVGAVLSTVIAALGPAEPEGLLLPSSAVPAATENVTAPFPEHDVTLILRVESPLPETARMQLGVPDSVILPKISAFERVLAAPVQLSTRVLEPAELSRAFEGDPRVVGIAALLLWIANVESEEFPVTS